MPPSPLLSSPLLSSLLCSIKSHFIINLSLFHNFFFINLSLFHSFNALLSLSSFIPLSSPLLLLLLLLLPFLQGRHATGRHVGLLPPQATDSSHTVLAARRRALLLA